MYTHTHAAFSTGYYRNTTFVVFSFFDCAANLGNMQTTNGIAKAQHTTAAHGHYAEHYLEQSVEHAWLKSIGLDRWNMEYSSHVAIDFEYSSMAEYMHSKIG
jgi:hypothetical protein